MPVAEPSAVEAVPEVAPGSVGGAVGRRRGRRDLAVFWWVNAVDGLGSQASGLVFPLLLLDLGHGPGVVGVFASAAALAGVALGPLVAVPADRGHRRGIMTGAAVIAAVAMAGLALACLRHPPLWLLLVLAFTERLCATAYETASRGALALLAPADDMPRAVANLQAGDQAALVAGPALGGALFGVGRFLPFVVDAVSYAATALGVMAIRTPLNAPDAEAAPTVKDGAGSAAPGTPADRAGPRRSTYAGTLRAGLTVVMRSPVLRLVLWWTSVASGGLTLLFYTAVLVLGPDAGSAATGGVLAVSGAAGLVGSLLAPRVVRRLGARRSLTAATWLLLPPCVALGVAGGPWLWGVCFGVVCLVLPVVTVVLGTAAVLAVPHGLQSRTGAVFGAATAVTAAGAPAVAAALVSWGGSRLPAAVCAAVLALLAVRTQRMAPAVLRPLASSETGGAAVRSGTPPERAA
ncbi:MFS transporter [Streptomyces heilongjiangensis]|uniref:MFS transporter n=1 Tax=Streptomyces heilongjiangensis TaxID=945052 RepID=A0ABW1AYZ1_9ACTN|nr:MFS transporter [Streptomyces heilongjiangensis]MDC2947956.1 MFS transporter [Streptomyces heilongjiangensis]